MKVAGLLLGASALSMIWVAPVLAQSAPQSTTQGSNGAATNSAQEPSATDQPTTTGPNASAPGQDSSAAAQGPSGTEVLVTARRRAENLMQTAISGSVLTGNDLANKGVSTVDALQFATPSLTVNNFGQGNNVNVRGIGKAETNTQTTTGVITYRDGVPSFPGYFQAEPYYDVSDVQVLRGPQGTIVGQNATGGAVFVNTNEPKIDGGYHGYINANYGNYNDAGAQGAINIPLSSTLAARVALFGERRDSYFNITGPGGTPYNGNPGNLREAAGRFSLLWRPSANFSVLSKTDLDYLDMGGYPAGRYDKGGSLFDLSLNSPQAARDKFIRSILRMEYSTSGGVRVRSVTGIQNGNTMYRADLDGESAPTAGQPNPYETFYDSVTETQFTQEFSIVSPDHQRFSWLVGAFGLWNTYFFEQPYQFVIDLYGGLPSAQNLPAGTYKLQGRNPERSLAAFGQVGFDITDTLQLELGGRYTASRSTNRVDVLQYGAYLRDDQTTKSDNFSYKASLGWKASPTQYLYGFVATGFRPGGLNVPVGLGVPQPFGPEKVTSYEAGLKSSFAGGHIRTTIDGFYNSYKGFQVSIGYPTYPTFGIELNVPNTTKIYGFEAEVEVRHGGLSIDGGINVLHSDLGGFFAVDPRAAPAGTAADPVRPCDPSTGPASTRCINLGGRDQTYAPNFTFNASIGYDLKFGSHDTVTPRINYGHVGAQWATLFEQPTRGDRLDDRNIVNGQIAWSHGSWTVTGYATNLTNQHYVAALGSNLLYPGAPRQYGLKVLKLF